MNNVLITGVAGMIGSHLLDRLLGREYTVTGIDNLTFGRVANIEHNVGHPRFTFYPVDILDFDTLKILAKDADTIVHLASVKKIAEKDSSMATLKVNAKGTENVFEAARMWGKKVIYASTSDVYGMSPDLPFSEEGDLLLGPSMVKRWSYAVAKLYGEQLAFGYHADCGLRVIVLRYFGGFSPRSSFAWSGGHIPIFIRAILDDQEVPIHGDGTQTRSMTYIDDLIDGTVAAMETECAVGEIINLGSQEEMSVIEAARLIHRIAATGKELKLRFIPLREIFGSYKDIMRRVPDLRKAEAILGYRPKHTMEQAIRMTIDSIVRSERASK